MPFWKKSAIAQKKCYVGLAHPKLHVEIVNQFYIATYAARCIENEILMHLRALKKTKKDVSLHDPIGQDKEGNEFSLTSYLFYIFLSYYDRRKYR
jgi:hypothetical protein